MSLPPLLRLRPGDPAYHSLLVSQFGGTYKSNWYFLIQAARSNLIQAAINTSKLIDIYERVNSRNQQRAETLLVMNLHYAINLAGPLLGTVLSVSAALEGFLRMSMRAFWEQNIPKQVRAKGTSTVLAKKLAEFDRKQAVPKLEQAYQTLLGQPMSRFVEKGFKDLVGFRNNCFHSDPVLILSTGGDQMTRGEVVREVYSPKHYPLLWHGNRPLSLSHALRAVRLHDAVVRDLFVRRSSKLYVHSDLHDEHPEHSLIENALPKRLSSGVLDELANTWDNVIERQLEEVPADKHREMILNLRRKATLHSID